VLPRISRFPPEDAGKALDLHSGKLRGRAVLMMA
jgi:hypothetical protein